MCDIILQRLKDRSDHVFGSAIENEKNYFSYKGYDINELETAYYNVIEGEYDNIINCQNFESSVFLSFIKETGKKHINIIQKIFDHCVEQNSPALEHFWAHALYVRIDYDKIIKVDNFLIYLIDNENRSSNSLRFLDDFPEKHEEFIKLSLDNGLYDLIEIYMNGVHYDEDLLLKCFGHQQSVNVRKIIGFKKLMKVLKDNNVKMWWSGSCDFTDNCLRDAYFTGMFETCMFFNDVYDLFDGNIDKIMNYYDNKKLSEVNIDPRYVDRHDIWKWLDARHENIIFRIDQHASVDLEKILSLAGTYPSRVKFSERMYNYTWCYDQNVDTAKKIIDVLEGVSVSHLNCNYHRFLANHVFTGTIKERVTKLIDFRGHCKMSSIISVDDDANFSEFEREISACY